MIRRAIPHFITLLCVSAAVLCLPALAAAGGSGGGAVSPTPGSAGPIAQPGNTTVTASGAGMTIATRASALLRSGLSVTGTLPAEDTGKTVQIQLWGAKTAWSWRTVAQTQVRAGGAFSGVWQTNHIGKFAIRAVLVQPSGRASASDGLPTVTVIVYRPSVATLYGPGFYRKLTACGIKLRRQTLGVANRTLPCGTPVAIYYQGRTLTVPVIDRGPYANGADWDLTMATGRVLGITSTVTLGAVSLPRR